MKRVLPPSSPSNLRIFTACLLSFLMLMSPIASVAASSKVTNSVVAPKADAKTELTPEAKLENYLFKPTAAAPVVGGVTATKTDSFPSHPSLQAEPGDTITYTVDVTNSALTDATGVTFTDQIDPNTTRFGADFDLKVSPLALNDTYIAEKNVALNVGAPGVLSNDTGLPAPTAVAIASGPTTQGGTVTLNADGSFNYTPASGFTGADTFTYTATNGQAPPNASDAQGTVTINVDARPEVTTTTPADNATDQKTDTNISITFSEPVTVTGTWFTISCSVSGSHTATVTGGPTTYTLNPDTDFTESETCTVTVDKDQVSDNDTNDPPDNLTADYAFDFTMDAAPTFTGSVPVNGASGVATNANIVITFSEPVTASTASFTLECPAGPANAQTFTVSDSTTNTITLDPTANLPAGTQCFVQIIGGQIADTDANDPPNNMTSSPVFSFTTDAPPTVSSTIPTQGATIVATNTNITLNFSEPVNIAAGGITLNCGAGNLAFTPTLPQNGVSSIVIDPAANLPPNTLCTVTGVSTLITDADSADPPNLLDGDANGTEGPNFALTFTTDAAPRVTSTTPVQGATQVGASANITLNFSEPVDIAAGGLTLNCGAGNLSFTPTLPQNGVSSIVINPDADLPFGTLCTVTAVAANITDVDTGDPPNQLDGNGDGTEGDNFTLTFTIDVAPSVTSTVPADLATDVAQSSTITINFSEPVDVAAGGVTINCGSAVAFTPSLPQNNVSSLVLTPTGGLPAGSNCTVTVDKTKVTDTDTGDPPDNMDNDKVFTFKVKPDAVNDNVQTATGQTVLGNVSFNSANIPYSVTTNDVSANTFTVTAFDALSANGGNVSVAANGQFTYNPPRGFEGSDTFNYTISRDDGGGTDTATVTITVSGMIWFIQNGALACSPNCGRLSNPYPTLAAFNTDNALAGGLNPDNNDNIFIYESASGYSGAVTLRSGQKLIGQDATASLYSITGLTQFSGHAALPTMNSGNGVFTNITNTVTMNTNSVVRGLRINVTGTDKGLVAVTKTGLVVNEVATISSVNNTAVDFSATSSGTFTFTNISASGSGAGLSFASTTSGSTVNVNNVTTTSGAAVTTSSTGATDFTFNDVTSTTGTAVSVNTSTGDFVFHAISKNGGSTGIDVNSATGSFTVNGTGTTAGSGGTIQNTTSHGAKFVSSNNITLKNLNLTNDAQTQTVVGSSASCGGALTSGNNLSCVAGLFLQTVSGVTLTKVSVTGSNQMGINGNNVTTFTMSNSTITDNGDETFENGLTFQNLKGTSSITDTIIKDNAAGQIAIANFENSSTLALTITGTRTNNIYPNKDTSTTEIGKTTQTNTFTDQALLIDMPSSGSNVTVTLNLTGVVFNNSLPGNSVLLNPESTSGTFSGTATNCSFDTTAGGVIIQAQNGMNVAYNVTNSEFNKVDLQSVLYSGLNPYNGAMTGTASGNHIGEDSNGTTVGQACQPNATSNCHGIDVNFIGGSGSISTRIQSNSIQQFGGTGILVTANSSTGADVNVNIANNTIKNPAGLIAHGIQTNIGTTAGANVDACLGITGNTVSGTYEDPGAGTQFGIVTNVRFLSHHRLPGYGGSSTAVGGPGNAVTDFIIGNNTTSSKVFTQRGGSGDYPGGAACVTPLLLAEGGITFSSNSQSLLSGSLESAIPALVTPSLTQQQLDSIVAAAIERWSAAGLTPQQIAKLRAIKFDIVDLGGVYLGEASENHILIDRNAGGPGWYVDPTPLNDSEFGHAVSATRRYTDPTSAAAGRIDLLTAIMHEMGHGLDLPDYSAMTNRDSLMYGYLTKGERRLPVTGLTASAAPGLNHGTHFLSLSDEDRRAAAAERSASQTASGNNIGKALSFVNAAMMPSGETVNYSIGTLPAGKHVRITFKVTINAPFSGTQVSNQGSVSGTLNASSFGPVLTDDPNVGPNTGETDPTLTPVLGPPDAINDAYTAFKNTPLNIAAPGVLTNDTNTPTVSAVGSCADVTSPYNCTTAQGGTIVVISDGSFIYTPASGYTGPDSFTYTATNSTGSDTATVSITVADTSAIYINEVLFNPPGTDAPNEYIELRGPAGATIPAGTYLVAIEGDNADNPGDVQTLINLSGLTFGTNGFLVLLQNGNTYTTASGATVITSTTTGFGGLPGGIFQADAGTDIEDASVTFMLVQTGVAPTLTDDIDSDNNGLTDGSVFAGWNVRDSISAMNGSANAYGYGAFSFRNAAGSGTSLGAEVTVNFIPSYVGRIGDSTGSTAADWVSSGNLGGAAPNWTLGTASETEPANFAGKPLNHIGASNFANLAPVNSVPVAVQNVNEDTTLTFNAANSNLISISDPDAGTADLKVTLTATNGVISLSGIFGLSFTTGDGTADATMTFTGTIANINTALNGLTFTPPLNYNGAASIQIVTEDQGNTGVGGNKTDTDTVNISVGAINDPPSFTKGADPTVNEDAGAQTVNGWATSISQGPGDPAQTLTFNITPNGSTGNLSFSSGPAIDSVTGNLTFTTNADTNGTATFNVTLSDNGSNVAPNSNTSGVQTFTINVTAINDAPSFQIPSNPPSVNEDAPAQTVNSFATNFQAGPVTATDETGTQTLVGYTVTQTGTTGNLTFTSGPSINNAGQLTYTPTSNTSGTATFNVVATDSGSNTAPNVNQSAPVSFTITVNGQNDAPVIDNTGNMSLSAINEDVPNASNSGTLVSDIIASAGGDRITDIDAGAVEGIAVTAVNNTNGTWQFTIDNGTNWTPFGTPDPTTARLLASDANTRVRFIPAANFNGSVNPGLTFRAWDQTSGTNGNTADVTINGTTTAFSIDTETASITVNPVNDTPTANAQVVGATEDTPVGITLTASDVETASGSLTFTVTSLPANGTLTGTAPNLTYTPNPNYNGPDSFTFTVTDTGDGSSPALTSASATVTINVGAVNDAPTANAQSVSTNEDTPKAITLTGNDIDTPAGSLTFIIVTGPTNGTLSPGTGPNRTYTPNANYNGPDSFTFKINDGTADSNTATVSITVNPVNDTPTANAQSVTTNEDTPKAITLTASDTETASGSLTYMVTVQPTNGVLSGTGANLTYTPNLNYNGPDSFKFTVTDTGDGSSPALTSSEATVSITVSAVNDAPVNTIPGAQNVTKNGSLTFNAANSNLISIADVDAGGNSVQVTLTATNGRLTLSGTAGLTFIPANANNNGVNDASLNFTGTIANINNALNGLVFEPTNGYDGPASIQIVTNDQGNTGSGGALSDTDTINITVQKGGVLEFSSATYTVAEDGGSVTITVNRTDGSVGTTKVDYTTSNGTATAGQDYTTSSGQLTFNNGVTSQTFTVPITNDALDEADETINLTLSNVSGSGSLGVPMTAVLTITDNDPQPSISISDATLNEGNSGTRNFDFTVTLSAASGLPVTVNYATANGSATAGSDYQAIPTTLLTFNPGETQKTISVVVNGDPDAEIDETFFVNLSGATNATISDNQGLGTILSDDTPVIQFNSATYTVNEDALYVTLTVSRIGDFSKAASINYTTNDQAGLNPCNLFNGIASPRCDYAYSVGKLNFAAGQASRDIIIPIVNDVYVEGSETFTITLSNSTGGDLGVPSSATITILDNDSGVAANPIDNSEFFIRQLYIDFLGRLPDQAGLAAWLGILNNCPVDDVRCDRIEVAAGFARSDEFANRGYFIYRFYRAALGRIPHYSEFIPDMARVSGFLSAQELEAAKVDFINDFMSRPEFTSRYNGTDATAYVTLLEQAALVTLPNRQQLINDLTAGTKTRAQVLRIAMETAEVYAKYYNEAFIVMNYFGFLRRDPDAAFQAWIDIFNHTNDYRTIINGFANSLEYRQRFGP